MSYSYIYHKNGINDKVWELFEKLLDGNRCIDGEKFENLIFCITNCSMNNNYEPSEIKNYLYNDLCDFIDLHEDTLCYELNKDIDFGRYYWDYNKKKSKIEITYRCLIDLQNFLSLCIKNDLSLISKKKSYLFVICDQ